MTIIEEIIAIANTLADQGKKPSVALIKTKLSQPAPLPTIINVLKNWQHQPNSQAQTSPDQKTPANQDNNNLSTTLDTLNEKVLEQIIAQALQPLKAELAEIKQQIQEIKNLK